MRKSHGAWKHATHPSVIASAAKQSRIVPRRQSGLLRCARNDGVCGTRLLSKSALSIAGTPPRSRGTFRPGLAVVVRPWKPEDAGKAGRQWHPQIRALQKCTRGWITGDADRPAFPARMVLTVSFVLSSGSVALLPPSPSRLIDVRARSGRHITARLGARTPGVGTTRLLRPRTALPEASRARVCSPPISSLAALTAPCRIASRMTHGLSALSSPSRRRCRVHRTPARIS